MLCLCVLMNVILCGCLPRVVSCMFCSLVGPGVHIQKSKVSVMHCTLHTCWMSSHSESPRGAIMNMYSGVIEEAG